MQMNTVTQNYLKLSGDIGAAPIPALLGCLNQGIKTCSITTNLTDGQVISLCAVLPLATTIEELAFSEVQLNINSWVAIADAASKSKALQKLSLEKCNFSQGQGITTFARTLGGCQVAELDIRHCKLGDDVAYGLSEGSLLKGDNLCVLRLLGCGLTDEAACRLAKVLESVGMMSSLKTLDLSFNIISDKGACALAAMLVSEGAQSSLPLQALELEGNMISDVGCIALAKAAKGALVLSRLCISNNAATGATLNAMAEAIRFNTGTLKEVAVAGARAYEDAAVALIRAAVRNNSLQLLDCRGVPLGQQGVNQLCQLMRYTTSINTLLVEVASREGAEAIAKELPHNRSLTHLTLGGPVPPELMAQMNATLAANTMRHAAPSPARSSPHIHAWIENATLGNAVSGHTAAEAARQERKEQRERDRTPSPGHVRGSPRSETGSMYSRGTTRTNRTGTSYLSFQFSQMSRKTGISSSPLRLSTSLAAGGAAEKAAVIFRKHDVNQDNYLNRDEMLAALQEVGVFNGIRAKHVGKLLEHEFKKADWDNDGRISLQDFTTYYEKVAYFQTQLAREGRIKSASHRHTIPAGSENNPALKRVFKNYCKYALGQGRVYADHTPQMNAQQFHRLVQDAGFVEPEGRLTTTAVDVVFYRYRPTGARRLGYKEFVDALAAVAYEAGMQFDDVMVALGCAGPTPEDSFGHGEEGGHDDPQQQSQPRLESAFINGPMAPHGLASIQELPTPLPTPIQNPPPAGTQKPGMLQVSTSATTSPAKPKTKKKGLASSKSAGQALTNPLYESLAASGKLEQRLSALETRLGQSGSMTLQDRSSSGGFYGGGVDAGVTAASIAGRLSKLEATVSQQAMKLEHMDRLAARMDSLQSILAHLVEENASFKAQLHSNGNGNVSQDTSGLAKQVSQLSGDMRGVQARMDGLGGQLATLQLEQRTLQMRTANMGGSCPAGAPDALSAVEKRVGERQARFEGALMQVARQVDVLDSKLKEEYLVKALESVLTSQGGGPTFMARNAISAPLIGSE